MTDPVRLRDPRSDATHTLRELVDAGRSELPDPERLRGVADRLTFLAAAAPGGSGPLAGGGGTGVGLAGAAKIGALVLIVGAGTGAFALRDRTTPVTSGPVCAATSIVEVASAVPQTVNAPEPVVPTVPASATAPVRAPTVRARLARSTAGAPSARAAAIATAEPTNPAPGAPATWGSSVAMAPEAPGSASGGATAGLSEEEREVVIIEALVRLGRAEEARPRAARFLRLFPTSPHRGEIAAPFGFDTGPQNP